MLANFYILQISYWLSYLLRKFEFKEDLNQLIESLINSGGFRCTILIMCNFLGGQPYSWHIA